MYCRLRIQSPLTVRPDKECRNLGGCEKTLNLVISKSYVGKKMTSSRQFQEI